MLISNRATNILLVAVLAVGIAIVAMLASGARGGPLDPSGAPGSTAGVLRPGTPITALPFTISAPGNYYLTKNLSLASMSNGITVDADDVTLDIGGFELLGSAGALSAIISTNPHNGLTVENGSITGWGQGIAVASINHSRFEHLRMRLVQSAFITWGLEAGSAAAVDAVDVSGANSGIKLGATSRIANCHVDSPGATGPTLGIQLGDHSSLTRCTTVGFQTGLLSGDGADIRDCNVQAAVNFGVDLAGYTTMTGCTVTANLVAAVITDGPENVLTNNRIETQAPATCVAMENTVGGQYRDNQLFNCGTIFAAIGSYTRMVGNLLASSGINTFEPAATRVNPFWRNARRVCIIFFMFTTPKTRRRVRFSGREP